MPTTAASTCSFVILRGQYGTTRNLPQRTDFLWVRVLCRPGVFADRRKFSIVGSAFIIITALPRPLPESSCSFSLRVRLSVSRIDGAIMCMGVESC